MTTPDRRITLRLSRLLKRQVADRSGESIGRLADVIVRLRGTDYPLVTGLVAAVGGREIFVPIDQVSSFDGDVLGHRLIDVQNARLVRAADLELARDDGEWVVSGVDTRRRPRRLFGLLAADNTEGGQVFRDWH